MPTYTSTTDIYNVVSEKTVAQLTDDAAGTSVDTAKIDSALDRAESVVDSYVGKAYTVPLSVPVLDSITHAVLTLAKCYLYKRRAKSIPEEITKDCEDMIEWLKGIRDGKIELDELSVATDVADTSADDQLFTKMVF